MNELNQSDFRHEYDPLADGGDADLKWVEPGPRQPKKGFGVQVRQPKPFEQQLGELLEHGDPEKTGKSGKRPKPINHNPRTAKFLSDLGYSVTKVEQWRILRSGFGIKTDLHGLFDFQGIKPGQPELYVQACSAQGKAQHLRDMTSTKIAFDNKRPKIENLRWHLSQGHRCALVVWTRGDNGRYGAEVVKITTELIEQMISRKRSHKNL